MGWFSGSKPKTVKCSVCKHIVEKVDAQVVWNSYDAEKIWYCPEHKVAYDEIRLYSSYPVTYYKYGTQQVTQEGAPFGYIAKVDAKWQTLKALEEYKLELENEAKTNKYSSVRANNKISRELKEALCCIQQLARELEKAHAGAEEFLHTNIVDHGLLMVDGELIK